jgi:hypothetical protein
MVDRHAGHRAVARSRTPGPRRTIDLHVASGRWISRRRVRRSARSCCVRPRRGPGSARSCCVRRQRGPRVGSVMLRPAPARPPGLLGHAASGASAAPGSTRSCCVRRQRGPGSARSCCVRRQRGPRVGSVMLRPAPAQPPLARPPGQRWPAASIAVISSPLSAKPSIARSSRICWGLVVPVSGSIPT